MSSEPETVNGAWTFLFSLLRLSFLSCGYPVELGLKTSCVARAEDEMYHKGKKNLG